MSFLMPKPYKRGKLEVKDMFAGKSSELLKRLLHLPCGHSPVLKPVIDDRYDSNFIALQSNKHPSSSYRSELAKTITQLNLQLQYSRMRYSFLIRETMWFR